MRPFSILALLALQCAAAPVPVTTTSNGTIHRWITVPARLSANQEVVLHAKVGGHLRTISVDAGAVVKAGQEIATLEVPELEADRIKAVAEVEVASAELNRLKTARKKAPGLVLPQTIDQAEGNETIAVAGLQRTEVLLGFAKITAPFDGIVTARHADPGAFIPAGGTTTEGAVVTLADLSVLRARVAVPEQEARFIKPGTPARIITSSNKPPLEAKVSRHGRKVEFPSATLTVEVDLPNADGKLLAGTYVKAQLSTEIHTDTMLLPVAALLVEKNSSSVFIAENGKAVKTKVTTGFNDTRNVEILTGLKGGEPCIILTGITLADGQAVEIAK